MMDKNSISEIDEKQENGAGSGVGDNWPDTIVEKNIMTSETQSFRLADFEQSQSTQIKSIDQHKSDVQLSSNITESKKDNNDDDRDYDSDDNNKNKSNEIQDTTSKDDKDGGEIIENENKVMIEAEKSGNDLSTSDKSVGDDDNDIVCGTPPDQLFSPGKRQLLGATSAHKRKANESDEPAAKISRPMDDNIIPATQESLPDANESLTDSINDNIKQCSQSNNEKEVSDTNENTVENVNNKDSIIIDVVNQESSNILPQAVEKVQDNEEKFEVDENNITAKEQSEEMPLESEIVDKIDIDEKPVEQINLPMKSEKTDSLNDDNVKSTSVTDGKKSRMSIEVIYDKSLAPPPKPKELVEIDEDGEKIILDSSHEDQTLNDSEMTAEKKQIASNHPIGGDTKEKIENAEIKMINGNKECLKSTSDSDRTAMVSTESDTSIDSHTGLPRIPKVPEILSVISDSEEDSFINEEKNKIKTIPIEKEIPVLIKVKCILHVDEVSKEIISKEVSSALCETGVDLVSSRRRTSSVLGLADISDAKDSVSPSSVTSNTRFPLNPRYSTVSQASTSSSSSSGSFKLPSKDGVQFSLPRGVPKHAKKTTVESLTPDDSLLEKLKKEWKNTNLLTTSLLNFLNSEIITTDLHNGTSETSNNSTSENFRSSTPETPKEVPSTPKNTGKVRLTKRTRSQNLRNSSSNGLMKKIEQSPNTTKKIIEIVGEKRDSDSTNESFISAASTPSRQSVRSLSILRNQTPVYDPSDALIGKPCFAKWGDNNYYPGTVSSRSKTKFKVTFLDGLSKLLMEDFIIAMPPILPVGLSIYASVKEDEYGSCGMIREVDDTTDPILYIVETDEGEKINVTIREIFLTTDQVIILRELMNGDTKSPPSTPNHAKVSLDNVVDGNRRNKSSAVSTPKSTRGKSKGSAVKKATDARPSGSGVPSKINFNNSSDTDFKTSDSGADDEGLGTIQAEIVGTSSEFTAKGPQHRLKGKARSKKKVDDQETIALLGPIPEEGSTLFKGINFILTCASLESLDKYKMDNKVDSNSESGTDLEQDWNSTPFVRERLTAQITIGGGKVYEKFEDIPKTEYGITKLITNVPNITAKSLQCLSVGIHSWNHKWVIRSCLDNKLVNPHQEKLPAGWSLDRKTYIEMSDRHGEKPFKHVIIAVPKIAGAEESTRFWQQLIENAGGIVRPIADQSDHFIEATAVLTNRQCPSWIEQRAQSEGIPLVSTTWIVQCLIAGMIISHETQVPYFHRYMK